MTRLRLSGRGIAYAASALIHGGVVVALLPSLTGAAAPTPAETPMAVEMAGFGTPAESVDMSEPVETAQAEPVETTPPQPVEPMETVPPETVQDQPVETTVEEPPPPAETVATETTEIQPPEPTPETPPPELVTTTGQTETVVAAVPETVQAVEPEIVQPPPTKPKPPAERRPQRQQPRRTERPAEASPTPAPQAALPPQPASPPPAPASAGRPSKSYADRLGAYLRGRIRSVNSMVREETPVRVVATIELDGTLSSIELTQSSGSASIDRELLRRLRAASPVPAPETRLQNIVLPFNLIPR